MFAFDQELLGELQTDEIWWHPKGLVKEDPTKPKSKLIQKPGYDVLRIRKK